MYMAVVFNSPTMERAKQRYANNKYVSTRWKIGEDLSFTEVIAQAVREAKVFKDTYTPKIFIVKD